MLMWIVLVVVGIVVLLLLLDMLPDDAHMPSACPKCGAGNQDAHRRWFIPVRKGAVRCRACEVLFKEHPNGSLVEDKGAPK